MYLKIIECIVAILCGCQLASTQSNPDISSDMSVEDGMITLKRIDLSQDSILYSIISDFSRDDIQVLTDHPNALYKLSLTATPNEYLKTFPKGYLVSLLLDTNGKIFDTHRIGYDVVDGKTIIISKSDDYNFKYSNLEEKRTFRYEPDFIGPYDYEKDVDYFMAENYFGKYIYGIGWVMYLPDGYKLVPSDNIVTAPKRKQK